MTDELQERYGEMRSRAEQNRDIREPKCARIEEAKAQARAAQMQGAAGTAASATGAAGCVMMVIAGLAALAAIFG